jgi:hypothetical protein
MIKRKKSQVFVFLIFVMAIVVLIYAYMHLDNKYTLKTKYGLKIELGDLQFKLIDKYAFGESYLFYLDQAAKYSLDFAIYNLAEDGGFFSGAKYKEPLEEGMIISECGDYNGYEIWSTPQKNCYPDYKTNFKEHFSYFFSSYQSKIDTEELPYEFTFDYLDTALKISGFKSEKIIELYREGQQPQEPEAEKTELVSFVKTGPGTPGTIVSFTFDSCAGGQRSWQLGENTLERIKQAEILASNNGYTLCLSSAYRTPEQQLVLWRQNPNQKYVCGPPPFTNCPHLTGGAVDVHLKGVSDSALESVMCRAGFVRYKTESWHFEYGTDRWKRGSSSQVCAII